MNTKEKLVMPRIIIQQDRQYTYNVTMWRVRETIVAVEKQ
jgi:hypothetical protein